MEGVLNMLKYVFSLTWEVNLCPYGFQFTVSQQFLHSCGNWCDYLRGLRAFLPFLKLVICLLEVESLVPYVYKDLSTLVKSPMSPYSLRVICNA